MLKRRIQIEGRVEVRFRIETDVFSDSDMASIEDDLYDRLDNGEFDDDIFGIGTDRVDFEKVEFKVLSEAQTDEVDPRQQLIEKLKAAQAQYDAQEQTKE